VNVILDAINMYRGIFDDLRIKLENINSQIGNTSGNDDQVRILISLSREAIGKLRKLISKAKRNVLFSGYKSSLHDLSTTVDDFEEHISDFKFRHDSKMQSNLSHILSGFSLSL